MAFNFDEWAKLAQQDQAAFEEKRSSTLKQAIEDTANSDSERRKLNGLQFKLDMLRRRHKSPLGSCIALSEMLLDNAYQLTHLDLDEIRRRAQPHHSPDRQNCKIIPFNRLKKNH